MTLAEALVEWDISVQSKNPKAGTFLQSRTR